MAGEGRAKKCAPLSQVVIRSVQDMGKLTTTLKTMIFVWGLISFIDHINNEGKEIY
jgi:hypothetical protein